MATSKPRITVTLEPEVYDTLRSLAEVQGRSMSSIVSEFLTLAHPVQMKVLNAIRGVLSLQKQSAEDLVHQLEKGHQDAEAALVPLLKLLDQIGGLPPPSNTGVTISDRHPKSTGKKSASPLF